MEKIIGRLVVEGVKVLWEALFGEAKSAPSGRRRK